MPSPFAPSLPATLASVPDPASIAPRPSKTQVKRDMHALLALGKQLVELSTDQLKRLPLSEALHAAILLAQRTTSREGRRRQIHYVGKLMRSADAAAIRQQLDIWAHGSRQLTAQMHQLETLRDRLMADDAALTALIAQHAHANPGADRRADRGDDITRLRTLIRESRKEARANENLLPGQTPQRKHYRALFQALKTLLEHTEPEKTENP